LNVSFATFLFTINSKLISEGYLLFRSNVDINICGTQYYCSSAAVSEFSNEAASGSILTSISEDVTPQSIKYPFKSEERVASTAASSNGRVMLIDGTSIIYRAYYKLLGNSATHVYIKC